MTQSVTHLHSSVNLNGKGNSKVPEIQDSDHMWKNRGDFYVQKSFLKSIYVSTASGMAKQEFNDLINARDIFSSNYSYFNWNR